MATEFVTIDGDPTPVIMYKPYIYAEIKPCSLGYIIHDTRGHKIIYDKKEILKSHGKDINIERGDGTVRDPNRIMPFLDAIGKLWIENVPDWRFSQLIENVFGSMDYIPWMLEEDRMLEEFENYFEENRIRTYIKN